MSVEITHTSSLSSDKSSQIYLESPDFFEGKSQRDVLPHITDSMEHNFWIEAQLNAMHCLNFPRASRKDDNLGIKKLNILKGIQAYVDVKFKNGPVLRQLLRELGALVYLRFSKNITHLIFWNGRQETLDKVLRLRSEISILSPHWVIKCFMDQVRANEAPYMLYGVTGLAIPLRLMAMGRIGTVNKKKTSRQSDVLATHSQLVYAIETLSDQLTSKLISPISNENVDVVEIISPIIDRVRKRLDEFTIGSRAERRSTKSFSTNMSGRNPSVFCEVSDRSSTNHTISDTSISYGQSPSIHQSAIPTGNNSKSTRTIKVSRNDPMKRHVRPSVSSAQLLEGTSVGFHKDLQRRFRSAKAKHTLHLNTDKVVHLYRKMVATPSSRQELRSEKLLKAKPVVVRTHSSVLNDLQNVPSSNEFVKKKKITKRRIKVGNIVLSGIDKNEKETVFAIARKLGVLKIVSVVDERTRYVVSGKEGVRTVNVMKALVKGIPVVTVEWAYRSLEIGGWLKGNDHLVPRWKNIHKEWRKGHLTRLFSSLEPFYVSAKCKPEAKHLIHLIRCCHGKVTESLTRAVIFVAPESDWQTFMLRRKNVLPSAVYITEQSLLDSICECKVNFL